jgi:hypothetical protein
MSKNEPQQYWAAISNEGQMSLSSSEIYLDESFRVFEVIKKAAYDRLAGENEKLREVLTKIVHDNFDKLITKVARAALNEGAKK